MFIIFDGDRFAAPHAILIVAMLLNDVLTTFNSFPLHVHDAGVNVR